MSFPRAKRFNDAQSCAPAPGAYDPKVGAKVKGAFIEKKERFPKPKCVTADVLESPSSSSGSEKSALSNCLPLLHTPVMQRKAFAKAVPHGKSADRGGSSLEEYRGRPATCLDHGVIIRDLEAQIAALTCRIKQLEHEISAALERQASAENEHELQLKDLTQKHVGAVSELQAQVAKCLVLQEQSSLLESKMEQSQKLCSELEINLSSQKELCRQVVQESDELKFCIEVLRKAGDGCLTAKDELDDVLSKVNGGLANELKELSNTLNELRGFKEKVLCLENKKLDLEKKLCIKQDLIISLQSELSSATVELEDLRLENEKLVCACVSERRDCESQVQQYKSMFDNLEEKLARKQEQYCTLSASVEVEMLALQSEVHSLRTAHEKEINILQQSHMEEIVKLLHENASIVECKESDIKALTKELEVKEEELSVKLQELNSLKMNIETECDEMTQVYREELDKIQCENSSIMEFKQSEIKSLQEKVSLLEAKVDEQQSELSAVKSTCETEIGALQEIHKQNMNKIMQDHASILTSKENVIASLRQSNEDARTKLADKERELDILMVTREKLVKYLHEYNMDDVDRMLQEFACALESKEHHIQCLQATITNMKAELVEKQREMDSLKKCAKNEMKMLQNGHEVKVSNLLHEHMTIIQSKEAALHTAEENIRSVEAKLRAKEREVDDLKMSQVDCSLSVIELQDIVDTVTLDLSAARAKLADVKKRLREKDVISKNLEVSLRNAHEAIDAIKSRLLETEEDVARLTKENETLVVEKLHLEREVCGLVENLEQQNLNIDRMEKEMRLEIDGVKATLLGKLDDFRRTAEEREHALIAADLRKQEMVDSLSADLEGFRVKLELLNEGMRALESQNREQESECKSKKVTISKLRVKLSTQQMCLASETERNGKLSETIENQKRMLLAAEQLAESSRAEASGKESEASKVVDLQMQLAVERRAADALRQEMSCLRATVHDTSHLEATLAKYKDELSRCMAELDVCRRWEARVQQLESLVGPFREQLQAFETERAVMLRSKAATEHELRQLALRHADMLGHQNHQQKIKHLVQLKQQNLELKQVVEKQNLQVKMQKHTINKLKEELATAQRRKPVTAQGKENVPAAAPAAGSSPLRPLPN